MKKILVQLWPFIKNYKKHVVLNILFNLLYALFGTLAFVSLIPMLNVLFDKTQKVIKAPVWNGIGDLKNYANDTLNFKITTLLDAGNGQMALLIVVGVVVGTFFLKNPRLSMMVRIYDKMNAQRKKVILAAADKFIKENTNAS